MIRAACHCGAVRMTLEVAPDWVLDCNCSICRRYGTLWAYGWDGRARRDLGAVLVQGGGELEAYIWGSRQIGLWRCKTCGCLTHHTALAKPDQIRAINARMFVNFDPASVTIDQCDNGHSNRFWTRTDGPIQQGHQPAMGPEGVDDWR